MPKGKFWTQQEVEFVKNNYSKMSCTELTKYLNRSYLSIRSKIDELGLSKPERQWSEYEIEFLKNNYETMSYKKIGDKIGRSKNGVQTHMRKLGLKKPEKYIYNVDYFEKINTEDKAYWLGFIFADGYISQGKGHSELGIELAYTDIEHLKKFNKCLNGNLEILHKVNDHTKDNFIKTNQTESCVIRLQRNKIVNDLKQYGINNKKTYTDNYISDLIPKNLVKHFIRGFFDGDGNVWFDKEKNKQLRYTIYNASYTLLNDIREELFSKGIYSQIIEDKRNLYRKTTPCYHLVVGGIANAYNFYNYLYDGANMWLDRKYEYANKYIEIFNIKERANKKSV